ncbi:MAG: glutamine synthetase family protein [Mariniphaga sp.]|nr:glutamine synthetase family protein [Mariniphaga sp.]
MNSTEISMNPNELVQFLKKSPDDFTSSDLTIFCKEYGIQVVNFRYVAEDGRLKTLNFFITSEEYLKTILTHGERVDGSSLFSFVEAGSSDLYVIPRFRTAFLNPFAEIPTLEIFCSFYNNEGKPLESDPGYILRKADRLFTQETGLTFKALGELEYYVIAPKEESYPTIDQKGYHECEPFSKYEFIRTEALQLLAKAGCSIKYGHAEVGSFTSENNYCEQHEIEFLPTQVERAAEQIILAKWILRMLGYKYGVDISFAPKITVGKAGNGMHFHMLIEKNGVNQTSENGKISEVSRKMIAGILNAADAITAFGNTIPTSYLRLVPHQEAPTNICWGDRNRSVVVRVPLGWTAAGNMISDANPQETDAVLNGASKQTFEFRVPDGSADIYLTMAALVVTSLNGIKDQNALQTAKELYVDGNIFSQQNKAKLANLKQLPLSCHESAEALEKKRMVFEAGHIFPKGLIDNHIKKLKSFNDKGLSEKILGKTDEIKTLVEKFIHVG